MTEKWTLRRRLGYRLYSVRYEWRHFWRETLPWKLAWLVPRTEFDRRPMWFLYGGLVFQRLTAEFLRLRAGSTLKMSRFRRRVLFA